MGIFDKFKKDKNNKEVKENNMLGWDAITEECERKYKGQNPQHFGTLIKWNFGGNDPLDGISVYDGGDYFHFVTYGLSELYEKESENKDISGYGMEFTFKLKKDNYENEEDEIKLFCNQLQDLLSQTEKYLSLMNFYTQVKLKELMQK